jgi:hypothetical protein
MRASVEFERKRVDALTKENEMLSRLNTKAEGSAHKQVRKVNMAGCTCSQLRMSD